MKLIDTHFHLDYYKNHSYWYNKINELEQYTICVTNSPEVYYSCKQLYPETKYVKFALGFNPQNSIETDFSKEVFLHQLSTTRYIGEVGLDFTNKFAKSKQKQLEVFNFICSNVKNKNKILNIHSRMAESDVLKILVHHNISNAIIHWYTGSTEVMSQMLEAGYYFSVNTNMCKTIAGRKILSCIPIERLLIESDGPFSKVEGKSFEPSDLKKSYDIIGGILKTTNINDVVYNNFKQLLLNNN